MRLSAYILSLCLLGAAFMIAAPAQACPAGYVQCGSGLCCPKP